MTTIHTVTSRVVHAIVAMVVAATMTTQGAAPACAATPDQTTTPVARAVTVKPKPGKTTSSIAATAKATLGGKVTVRGTAKTGGKPLANTKVRVFYAHNATPTPESVSKTTTTDTKGRWKLRLRATQTGYVRAAIRVTKTPARTQLWKTGPKTRVTGPVRPHHPDVNLAHPDYSGQPRAAVETESSGPDAVVLTAAIDWEPAGPLASRTIDFTVTRPDGTTPVAGAVIQATVEEHPAAKQWTRWEEFEIFQVTTGPNGQTQWTGTIPSMIPYLRYRVLDGTGVAGTPEAWMFFGERGVGGDRFMAHTDARFTVCEASGTELGCYETPEELLGELNWLWAMHGKTPLRSGNEACEGRWQDRAWGGAGGGYRTPGRALWNNPSMLGYLWRGAWAVNDPAVYGLYGLSTSVEERGVGWVGNFKVVSCQPPDPQ
jgi:hypothetical protein